MKTQALIKIELIACKCMLYVLFTMQTNSPAIVSYMFLEPQADRVKLMSLLEIQQLAQCDKTLPYSPFALSLALVAEYTLDLVNSNKTDIAVPGVSYGTDL